MDAERLQNLEARMHEQAEATRATNELISQLFSMMRMRNIDDNVPPPPSPSVSLPSLATSTGRGVLHPSQPRSVLHSLRIKLAGPDNFDGDRSKGHAFLTSCELYLSLAGPDYPDEQSRIHWALSFFKSGRAAMFSECMVRQEMRTGVMAFADWTDFTSEFMSTFCPDNEATSALMHLECKGMSIYFLTLTLLSYSPLVHMYLSHTFVPSPGTIPTKPTTLVFKVQ
jgi:hypothetical protein